MVKPQSSTPLQAALAEGFAPDGNLSAALERIGADYPLVSTNDAAAVCEGLGKLLADADSRAAQAHPKSPAATLAGLLQDVASPEALSVVHRDGLPRLVEWHADLRSRAGAEAEDVRLLLLKLFAMFNHPAGIDLLVEEARSGLRADDMMWAVVFHQFDGKHPSRHKVVGKLKEPLPPGLIGLAVLNLCNALALAGELSPHPFSSPEGVKRLLEWLDPVHPAGAEAAKVVATSIPFLPEEAQTKLLPKVLFYPSAPVRLEGAWAAARLGRPEGWQGLMDACRNPFLSASAVGYLKELGREDLIPGAARDPVFQAAGELCRWLAHPMEFGRPPEGVELVDSRDLYWPPTNDQRRLWLFRYGYHVHADDEASPMEWRLGLVGSMTFSLWLPDSTSPEDAYALHCCWELQAMRDPRAPAERSVEAGRKLLSGGPPRRLPIIM